MKVSVIIPSFNMAGSLCRAIDSALPQADEVLVVDDGSTDDTLDVLRRIRHSKLRVHEHKQNRGVVTARNTAIALADGDWFLPLDADDALNDNVIPILRAAVDARTFAYGDWLEMSQDVRGGPLPVHKVASEIGMINRKNVAKATFLFSRTQWQEVGGYDSDFEETGGEDWSFMLALVEAGFRGMHVPVPVYYYEPALDGRAAKVKQHEAQVLAMFRQKYPRTMNDAIVPNAQDAAPAAYRNG